MEQRHIEFYEDSLISIKNEHTGEIYVSMKHVCQSIGIAWSGQHNKLKENGKNTDRYHVWGCQELLITTNGVEKETIVIPVNNINGWLLQLNPKNLRSDKIRQKLIRYQKECFQVLYDYWNKGAAVNPRIEQSSDIKNDISFEKVMSTIISGQNVSTVDMLKVMHKMSLALEVTLKKVAEGEIAKKKLEAIFDGKKSKLLIEVHKKLDPVDQDGNVITYTQGCEFLRKENIFRKYKNLPYETLNHDNYFSKVELPTAGINGIREYINILSKNGGVIRHPEVQQLLTTNIKGQKALPMNITKVNFMETSKKIESNDDSKKILEDLESKPVLTPPFKDQIDTCDIQIPAGEKIH